MKMNREGIGTLGAALIVMAVIGSSMWVLNEYEKNQILTDAELEAQGSIYNISAIQSLTLEASASCRCFNIYGDRMVYAYDVGSIIRGYNFTSETKFTVYDANATTTIIWVDVGELGVSWLEKWSDSSNYYILRTYFWSNGTYHALTPLKQTSTNQPLAMAITGNYSVYPSGKTIRAFNMDTWEDKEILDLSTDRNQLGVMDGGKENQAIYFTWDSGGYSYSYINVETKNVKPIITQTSWQQYATADVWDNNIAFSDYSGKKIKTITISGSSSTTVETVAIGYYQGFVAIEGDYLNYAYLNDTVYTVKFYDIHNDVHIAVGAFTIGNQMTRVDSSDGRVILASAGNFHTYTYSVEEVESDDHDGNATTNGNDDDGQTTAEAAQEWITSNWYIVVGAVMAVVVVAYIGWKRLGETEYAESMASFGKKVNWGIVIAIGLVTAIGILLFL